MSAHLQVRSVHNGPISSVGSDAAGREREPVGLISDGVRVDCGAVLAAAPGHSPNIGSYYPNSDQREDDRVGDSQP